MMRRRYISLTTQHDKFLKDLVKSGEYPSAGEIIRVALILFQQRVQEHLDIIRTRRELLSIASQQALATSRLQMSSGTVRGGTATQRRLRGQDCNINPICISGIAARMSGFASRQVSTSPLSVERLCHLANVTRASQRGARGHRSFTDHHKI